jgi:hypothetical protein
MSDLMERLAAADPLRDDEQQPDEALLARIVATPVEPVRQRHVRRYSIATAAVAAAAAVAAVVFVGSDADEAVAARSAAALSDPDSLYHVVQRRTVSGELEGGRFSAPVRIESWYAPDGRMHEKFFLDDGRFVEEAAGKSWLLRWNDEQNRVFAEGRGPIRDRGKLPLIDPTGDPGATLRSLEERGALKEEGTSSDGYRLVSDTIEVGTAEYRFEYVVDKETYLPTEQRWTMTDDGRTFGMVREFQTYERLPLDDDQLDLDPHPDAECARDANQATEKDLGFVNPCRG